MRQYFITFWRLFFLGRPMQIILASLSNVMLQHYRTSKRHLMHQMMLIHQTKAFAQRFALTHHLCDHIYVFFSQCIHFQAFICQSFSLSYVRRSEFINLLLPMCFQTRVLGLMHVPMYGFVCLSVYPLFRPSICLYYL